MMAEGSSRAARPNYFWVCLLACSTFGCSSQSSTVEGSLALQRDAILGGQPDTTHTAVVAVTHDSAACSGTVIEARDESAWILTAGHCVVEVDDQFEIKDPIAVVDPSNVRVTLGSDYADDLRTGASLPAIEIRIHPGYNGFSGNPDDIALVRVPSSGASLMTLPTLTPASDDVKEGEPVTLVGFGMTEDPENSLRHVTQQTVAWLDQHFIGLDQTNGIGVCHGDSGGPVLVVRNGNLTVAGVNSVGTGARAQPCGKASTSTRISRFAEWLTNAPGGAAGGASVTAGTSGTGSGAAGEASGGAGGAVDRSPVTTSKRNAGGCAISRSSFADSPCRLGLLALLALLLSFKRREGTGRHRSRGSRL